MQVVLVMFRGEGERRSFSIARDVTVVGRREDCDFRIPLGEISRKHCRLIKDGSTFKVEDLGSSNGTFHNGTRIQSAELQPGDTLQMGSVAFVVQIEGVPAEDELQPVTAGSRQTATNNGEDDENPEATVQDRPARSNGNGHSHKNTNGNGEFDPMSVLDADAPESDGGEGSGVLPMIEDSHIGSDVIVDLASGHLDGDTPAEHA